ncbi:MAG: DUF4198 domain-containing protein [Bacteroidota bacterium]
MKKQLLLTLFLNLFGCSIYAHAIWIEANNKGAVGKAHEIKIFYGEYAAKEFEENDKWYSDVNTFTLWLVSPDGTRKQLECKPGEKHFLSSFTPEKQGTYIVATAHSAKDLDGTMMYQFNASAVVTVATGSSSGQQVTNDLYLQPEKSIDKKHGAVKAFYKGKPAGKITITVFGPSGWSKNFQTDENGVLQFELLWKGWYALEGSSTVTEKGTHYDKPYEEIWRCATLRLNFE